MQKAQQLRREQRLLTAADYRQVFQHPSAKAGKDPLLMLARPNSLHRHRLGLAIAKKHVPTAVKRNLIKRLIRENFRQLKPAQPALDIVILSRPAARDADRVALNGVIAQLFEKLGLETHAP